jgi:phosphoribosylaminoimidazolecarboxamide formyltransferase/IMP cyclohydrolase
MELGDYAKALLSVSNKNGIVDPARGLARALRAGRPVNGTDLDGFRSRATHLEVTGFPEKDPRQDLHPNIHGVSSPRDAEDMHAITRLGIQPIDVVVVNLYPFAATAAKPGVTFDELVEQIDIGGPSMVRAAAKNFRDVLIVVDPTRYDDLLRQLDSPAGPSLEFRFSLAQKRSRTRVSTTSRSRPRCRTSRRATTAAS